VTVTETTTRRPSHVDEEKCRAFQYAAELVGRRWTGAIMLAISLGAERFVEIRRLVDGVSDRLLSVRLKELEAEGLVVRTVVPTYPAYSRYTLSPRGAELIAALQPLIRWGVAQHP
jgi:DNA-binding HxlR family transcriptional regulator